VHLLIGCGYTVAGTLALPRDHAADSGRINPFDRPLSPERQCLSPEGDR